MNRLKVAMALGGLVLMRTGSAYAQAPEMVRAKIPFAFEVGSATLPAGEYELRFDPAETQRVLAVSSTDGRHQAYVLTEPVEAGKGVAKANRLVFERKGTGYALSKVFADDSRAGLEVLGTQPAD